VKAAFLFLIATALVCAPPPPTDLAQVRAEPNLEKRASSALDYAERTLKGARRVYSDGDLGKTEALLNEIGEAVALTETSLKETGKNPIKSPKHFKNAEIRTRGLIRGLDAFERDMNAADRPITASLKEKVQDAHDRILQQIMTGKKK
jgi:hypothetical protein